MHLPPVLSSQAGLQKKKDSFLGRDQENLDKFLQNNGWLVC